MNTAAFDKTFAKTPLLAALPETLSIHSIRTDTRVGYHDLVRRVEDRAKDMSSHLPDTPARVVIGRSDPVEVLIDLFATWVAGHCAVLVTPKLAEEEKTRVIAKVAPHMWSDDAGFHVIEPATGDMFIWPDAALVLMTSGTTGDPKGITHSLATLQARLELNIAEIGSKALSRTLCPLPLFFGHGLIGNCLTPLYAGQTLHLLESPGLAEFVKLGALIDAHDITFLSSVPSFWRMVLRMSPPPVSPPMRVHVGSAPLPDELWRQIEDWCGSRNVFNTYGMTETANWISGGMRPAKDADGFVGKPWGGQFYVSVDGDLKSEGRGEVVLTSPSMMLGLWGTEHSDLKGETLFTGDIGEIGSDRALRLVGRTKNEINRGGIKVLAEEVDMLLERHPDVAEACAFGIPDDISGELVGAVVRVDEDAHLTEQALVSWCRDRARHEAVPSRLAFVAEIAKTDRGKLARQAIQKEMISIWF